MAEIPLMSFEEWQNIAANPPTSWNSFGMDWENPNPVDSRYWQAIVEAIKERRYVTESSSYYDGSYDFIPITNVQIMLSNRYHKAISFELVLNLIEAIRYLSKRFVDITYTDYENYAMKYHYRNYLANASNMPRTLWQSFYVKYPLMASFSNRRSAFWKEKLKNLLIEMKSALCEMVYTPCGFVKKQTYGNFQTSVDSLDLGYPNGWQKYGYICSLEDFKKACESDLQYRKNQSKRAGYSSISTGTNNNINLYSQCQMNSYVGMIGVLLAKSSSRTQWILGVYNHYYLSYNVLNRFNLNGEVYALVYVTDFNPIDTVNDGSGDRYEYTPFYFGYNKGFNMKSLGSLNNSSLVNYEVAGLTDMPYFFVNDVPNGDWGGAYEDGNPPIEVYKMVGCSMMSAIVVNFGVEGGFKFY